MPAAKAWIGCCFFVSNTVHAVSVFMCEFVVPCGVRRGHEGGWRGVHLAAVLTSSEQHNRVSSMTQRAHSGLWAISTGTTAEVTVIWWFHNYSTWDAPLEQEIKSQSLQPLSERKRPWLSLSDAIKYNLTCRNLNMVVCHLRGAHYLCGTQIDCDSVGSKNENLFSFMRQFSQMVRQLGLCWGARANTWCVYNIGLWNNVGLWFTWIERRDAS